LHPSLSGFAINVNVHEHEHESKLRPLGSDISCNLDYCPMSRYNYFNIHKIEL